MFARVYSVHLVKNVQQFASRKHLSFLCLKTSLKTHKSSLAISPSNYIVISVASFPMKSSAKNDIQKIAWLTRVNCFWSLKISNKYPKKTYKYHILSISLCEIQQKIVERKCISKRRQNHVIIPVFRTNESQMNDVVMLMHEKTQNVLWTKKS